MIKDQQMKKNTNRTWRFNLSQDRNVSISITFILIKKSSKAQANSARHLLTKTSLSILISSYSLVFSFSQSIFFGLFGTFVIANMGHGRLVTSQILARQEVLMVVCELLAQGKVIKGTGQAMFRGPQPAQVDVPCQGKGCHSQMLQVSESSK